ncbi:MAG: outer membrane beta-barrel protein [Beijerinckiaceae bacterium]|nr:outer membrane beta-barrel protein [Beijerinckiaceae bacterium]
MRKGTVSFLLLVGAMGVQGAHAGDLPRRTAPSSPYVENSYAPQKSWQGCYAGAHAGGGFGGASRANTSGALIGGHGGCNVQQGRFVAGLEGDASYTGVSNRNAANKFRQKWLGSVRGRAGYLVDEKILAYGTVGLGVGSGQYTDASGRSDDTQVGWVAGAGVEYKVTDNISARAEYLHYDLGRGKYRTIAGPTNVYTTTNVLRVGGSYHF